MKIPRPVRMLLRQAEMSFGMASRYLRKIDGAVIVTYHGVEPRESIIDPEIQSVHIDPESFKRQLQFIVQHFDVIQSVNELEVADTREERPKALITFDDGYKNFITHALPVLETLGIPSTLFVTANCIELGTRHPAYVCRATVGNLEPGRYDLESISESLEISSDNRTQVGRELAEYMKHIPWERSQKLIAELEGLYRPGELEELHAKYSSDSPMSWDEINEARDRGVEIGSHTLDHTVLGARQSVGTIKSQVVESRRLISERVGECRLFAYPNGAASDICRAAVDAVKDAGYEYAFSTVPGVLSRHQLPASRFALPRLSVSGDWAGFRKYVTTAWRHNVRHESFVTSLEGTGVRM